MRKTTNASNTDFPGAVIYCRVSTKEQTLNLSLPTQLKACREYCSRNGLSIVKEFEDAGVSAKTIDRPDFQSLINYCRTSKGRVRFVIVYNLTRFSRDAHQHAIVRALLMASGVSLRSVSEPISDDSVGKLTENLLAAIGQFDNDVKSDRTKAGMKAALERGRWTWRAPLGFLNGKTRDGEPSLIHDPERAGFIRQAFELAAEGTWAVIDVLRTMSSVGLRSRKGLPVSLQTFNVLIRNPIYAARLTVPAFSLRNAPGDFEPIVSEALFERVQAVLRRGGASGPHRKNHPDFPLRRFVWCRACSTPLTGSAPRGRRKRYAYYHCRKCKGVSIRKEALETQFVALLDDIRPNGGFLRLFRAVVLDMWKERRSAATRIRVEFEDRIRTLRERETTLENAYLFELRIDGATYERQRDRLRQDLAMCELELQDAKGDEIDVEGLLGFAEHVLTHAGCLWLDADVDHKRRIQRALFPNGVQFSDGRLGTAVTCLAFCQLERSSAAESSLASQSSFTWNQIEGFLKQMATLRESIGFAA